jgi:protocatechuate 3,4-dioxygenase beta subunit
MVIGEASKISRRELLVTTFGALAGVVLLNGCITDITGVGQFKTIYPGWYSGRACHIHIKVRTGGTVSGPAYNSVDSTAVHGGQIFFPPDINESLHSLYNGNSNEFINNVNDRVYNRQGGAQALLTLTGSFQAGFAGSITVDVKS